MGQLSDVCIHLRDCARPLGLAADVALGDWRSVLDWLPTRQASRGLVPRGRLDGLLLRVTDQDWSWGAGSEVAGPSEPLAMAVAGRTAALPELEALSVICEHGCASLSPPTLAHGPAREPQPAEHGDTGEHRGQPVAQQE